MLYELKRRVWSMVCNLIGRGAKTEVLRISQILKRVLSEFGTSPYES